jgi:hypothetical protein
VVLSPVVPPHSPLGFGPGLVTPTKLWAHVDRDGRALYNKPVRLGSWPGPRFVEVVGAPIDIADEMWVKVELADGTGFRGWCPLRLLNNGTSTAVGTVVEVSSNELELYSYLEPIDLPLPITTLIVDSQPSWVAGEEWRMVTETVGPPYQGWCPLRVLRFDVERPN